MADHAHDHGHGDAAAHHGPTTGTYIIVAVFLTVVTALEVGIYYVEAIRTSAAFVPVLLFLSAMKFFTVVGFYMHLKYDHKVFRRLFGGPFLIAISTMLALLLLFGQIAL